MKNLMFVFDRMPDQDGCIFIEVEDFDGQSVNAGEWRDRPDGTVELVVPVSYSPSFDEAKERELFECALRLDAEQAGLEPDSLSRDDAGYYCNTCVQSAWLGWSTCAKSRAHQ